MSTFRFASDCTPSAELPAEGAATVQADLWRGGFDRLTPGRMPRSARRWAQSRDYRGFAPPQLVQRLRNSAEGGATLAALSESPQRGRVGALELVLLAGLLVAVAVKRS